MSRRVIIVGAGPGGLAAALTLCEDHEVVVVEKNAWPGGRMGRIVEDGYAFDTGPSILQYPQVLDEVFAAAGARREDYVELMPVEPYTHLKFWDGSELDCWRDEDRMRASMEALAPGLGDRFVAWARHHEEKHRVAYGAFIASPADSMLGYFNPLNTLPAAKFKPWQSLHKCLMDFFEDERPTYAFSYPAKYLGLHPTSCSSVFSVIAYLEYAFGVWHPRGGFRALADGMKRCAEERGVRFMMEAPVKEIMVSGQRAHGVALESGERLFADMVVCNADFGYANMALIDPLARAKYTDAKLHRMKYSCSTFMMYLGLDRRWERPHHSIYLSRNTKRTEPAFLEDATLDVVDPPFYVCNPCATEGSSAPDGHSTLYILVPCPNTLHHVRWETQQAELRERVFAQLPLLGFDGVTDHIRFERTFTAQTWRDDFNIFQGAVFNLAHTWDQIGPLRPRCKSEDVERLFWVGGGTHPGSGLLTIFESAKLAAQAIRAT
jgi:phytoene desaturase